ncbi:group I truncated hemoglobin [Hymenobacter terrenus]|uniref:group I truncated hemoglobin n=1 Tax=Hymenobacter terrenus TaxID=1629124 RepID=UPI0006190C31|nr:group 1 truncated hemoglobin [Hymenobacter terrenus]
MKSSFLIILITSFGLFTSCKKDKEVIAPTPLYQRIGGEAVVTDIIDQTITNIITDNRINFFFAALATDPTKAQTLRKNLIDQLGQLSGGNQQYTGRTMTAVHTGMNINTAQFAAFIEDFTRAIDSKNLPAAEKAELIALYQNLSADIIGK